MLSSPGHYQRLGTGVDVDGIIFLFDTGVGNTGGGVRPALWLSLVSPWDLENFINVKEPLLHDIDRPHGELSILFLRHMNDNLNFIGRSHTVVYMAGFYRSEIPGI